MVRWTYRDVTLLFCAAVFCGSLLAQTGKTITLRMLDGKTGKLIATSYFLVTVDHEKAAHADWVVQNEDGTGKLTLPKDASVLSIQATYDSAMSIYVNCDSAEGDKDPTAHWYSVAQILASGVVAPNGCVKPRESPKFMTAIKRKEAEKPKPVAKPGEFVFYVRERNLWENARDFSSQ